VKDFIVKKSFSLWKKRKTIGFIDDFDNRISKNVMTSYELLKSLLSSDEKRPEILMLQTQEAYYYLTKSIRMIFDAREYLEYSIMNCDPNECFKNRKIHMGRFKLIIKSITNLHDEIYKYASDKFENETDNYGTCNMHDVNATLLAQINDRLELMPKNDNSNE
ncbi:MAG: hypothetical protein RBR44_04250, partial [Bacilli bacterium]|nr:hypothetical protein [Bacilli bacterium]